MPVSTVLTVHRYKPGAAMLPEPIPFPYLSATDLVVTHVAAATGVRTVLAGGYVIGAETIRATTAWPANDVFEVSRDTALIQPANVVPHQPVPAVELTLQLDRMAMAAQERRQAAIDLEKRVPALPTTGPAMRGLFPVVTQAGGWGFTPAGPGATGPAANTYTTLNDLLASDPSRLAARLVPMPGDPTPAGVFDFIDGQWVRQRANGIAVVRPAGTTNVEAIVRERVTTSGYGATGAALQAAIDSGAREVIVNNDIIVLSDVLLRSGQTLRFAGGRLIVAAGATIEHAVLYSDGGNRITLIDPIIDASAVAGGIPGIKLFNVTRWRISDGELIRCNMLIDSSDNSIKRQGRIKDTVLNMDGYASTGIYLSGVRGVVVRGVECYAGAEGIGIYNNARKIALEAVTTYLHTRDGFVVIAGQQVAHTDCKSYSNGQSGFTTQRQTDAENTRFIGYKDCHADLNGFDGFDMRGANDDHAPWDRDPCISLSGCSASLNVGCAYYIVRAQGTKLVNCTGRLSGQQNLLIDTSDRVTFANFQSLSGATAIASGTNKAGCTIYNSNMVSGSLTSGNWETEQQDWAVSITGTSTGCSIHGGDLSNNSKGPFVAPLGNSVSGVSGADTAGGQGYRFDALTSSGTYRETGFGVPVHFRPKGSQATDVNGPANYLSNGLVGGNPSWTKMAVAA